MAAMICARLQDRLDSEGVAGLTPAEREHARSCFRCADALSAAEAVEAALQEAPPAAPMAMVDHVMERVLAVERAALRARESARAQSVQSGWRRYVAAIAEEPVAAVAVALAPVVLTLGFAWPGTVLALRAALAPLTAAALGTALAPLTAPTRVVLDLALLPTLLTAGFFAVTWVAEALRTTPAPKRPGAPRPR